MEHVCSVSSMGRLDSNGPGKPRLEVSGGPPAETALWLGCAIIIFKEINYIFYSYTSTFLVLLVILGCNVLFEEVNFLLKDFTQ